jgi:DNA-binding transcriptional ArsR family regulator
MANKDVQKSEEDKISGSTFRVYSYLYLHRNENVRVRKVQRALGFTSPSSALFQLEKLQELGLVEKRRSGVYYLLKRQKIGILRDFVIIRSVLIPWMLVYALIISLLTTMFILFFIRYGTLEVILATIPSILASFVMWVEAYKVWNSRPKFFK